MTHRYRSGGIAAWAINRPVATLMLTLTVVILGLFALSRLNIDLLPHLIYPEIGIRINDPGVPVQIMEDTITRQLEEQLAITEDAISIQSTTSEGRSSIDLTFPYGKDIDIALRDASTRLDRAKRFLPNSIEAPLIFKRDPSQTPVLEMAISSATRNNIQLRDFVEYDLSRWFINLPGVASAEVGGGQVREIQIYVDQERLANFGFNLKTLADRLHDENIEAPGGRITLHNREISTRVIGRFANAEDIGNLPLWKASNNGVEQTIRLKDVARISDTHQDERLRVRLNGTPGIKLSIQKQPTANTVQVVDAVRERMQWLQQQNLQPGDIQLSTVSDQSIFVRHSLNNATSAATSGAILAMLVVYLFLGNFRHTLIIGTAIPLSIVVTFIIMAMNHLTLNIMTLGGLALGVGMVVDSTIVMLENITRHQSTNPDLKIAAHTATTQVTSAIVASTTTNLAAILPFLFIGGLIGLLFNELIFTLTAAMLASLIVSITVVPALAANWHGKVTRQNNSEHRHKFIDTLLDKFYKIQQRIMVIFFRHTWKIFAALVLITCFATFQLLTGKADTLPKVDQGLVTLTVKGEKGIDFHDMDAIVRKVELLVQQQPEVLTVFTTSGGRIYGRSEILDSNVAQMNIQLRSNITSDQWITRMRKETSNLKLVGKKISITLQSVRGIRTGQGDSDISLRISGSQVPVLKKLGDELVDLLRDVQGIHNLDHTYEDIRNELVLNIDRDRAAVFGITVDDISNALKISMEGVVVSKFLEGDRQHNIRIRIPSTELNSPHELGQILVGLNKGRPVRISDVASFHVAPAPTSILHEQQRRIVEVSATLDETADIRTVMQKIDQRLIDFRNKLPSGYNLYDSGSLVSLQEGEKLGLLLTALALFLVYVVMAVQYESLRNPLVIILSVPFTLIGVWIGLLITNITVSMPVWLGIIMLAGIVVNNAIVLVEQIEIERQQGQELLPAIYEATRLRLRPILMTTLTTVVGMIPLALGLGEGAEMLQPLAITIVFGLMFATVVSLLLVPSLYRAFYSHI